jgi:hypothetical protein
LENEAPGTTKYKIGILMFSPKVLVIYYTIFYRVFMRKIKIIDSQFPWPTETELLEL